MYSLDYLNDPSLKPNASRMYDYFLGGFHNFAIDRDAAEQLKRLIPDVVLCTHAARAFLRRTVTFLVQQGIDQFLDIGSGIPTVGNVHSVVQPINPHARIVYVDTDPLTVLQSTEMLHGNDQVCAIRANACQPAQILQHPDVERMLDWSRPMAVLMGANAPFHS
ncbi:MAG: SAM-dependent methyltransferase [Herpetosiphonaceae bacterium]|nr:SAM-dependent methyltransferase [Herpetosiphonaceae bacterium]